MSDETELYEHAVRLVNGHGGCIGSLKGGCSVCFVTKMCEDLEGCAPELALECAQKYLKNHGPGGNLDNIWEEVNNGS